MFAKVTEMLNGLSDTALDDRIRGLELQRRRLDAEFAAAVAVADHRQLPAIDGHRSINGYLRATINCSSAEASRLRGAARAVDHVDGLGNAWFSGRIGASQVTRLARVHGNRRVRDRMPGFAPMLLEVAEELEYADFDVCVDRFVAQADPDGAHQDRDDAIEHRDAQVRDVAGMVDIIAHGGDGVTAAELIAIHRRFTDAEYRADVEVRRTEHGAIADQFPLARTNRQRRFDALASIFRAAAAANGVGAVADPLVNIIIDAASWSELMASSGLAPADDLLSELLGSDVPLVDRRCETSTGVQVDPHDVLRVALVGHVRRAVVDSAGVVVDLGRRQRLFVGPAREAAKLLLYRCEHPGCELSAEACDVDHATEWADGGTTDQTNARPRCSSHNVDKSRRRWRSRRGANGRSYTIRADGTIMIPVGARRPSFPDDDEDAADVLHLTQLARSRAVALTASE